MTLVEVGCHSQRVESGGTPECFCIQTTPANVRGKVFVFERCVQQRQTSRKMKKIGQTALPVCVRAPVMTRQRVR